VSTIPLYEPLPYKPLPIQNSANRVPLRSFLVKIVGLFSIKIKGTKNAIYLVCMENCLSELQGLTPEHVFDLKGSKAGRYVKPDCSGKAKGVLKDLNWKESLLKIRMPRSILKNIKEALTRDVNMMRAFNIVDYSLLVGVNTEDVHNRRRFWISVIDILQLFNMKKRGERFVKKSVLGQKDVSCEDTITYATRFLAFAFDQVFAEAEESGICDIGMQGFEAFM